VTRTADLRALRPTRKPDDLRRTIECVEIRAAKIADDRARMVRLYCSASPATHGEEGARYALQLRAPRTLVNGREGRDMFIASASLSVADARALRDALNERLRAAARAFKAVPR